MVVKLHDFLGVPVAARPLSEGVQAVAYRGPECHYLIVLNDGREENGAEVLLDPVEFSRSGYVVRDLLGEREQRVAFVDGERKVISVHVKGKNGTILEIRPA